jgi:pimeloyl-ACP methyl ester carboxylesterase
MNPDAILTLCKNWVTGPSKAIENEAVISEIPTLILSGEFDPITPPEWGRLTAKTLSNAQFFEFPGFSHGILGEGPEGGECTFKILDAFFTDPYQAVDANCIDDYPPLTFTP